MDLPAFSPVTCADNADDTDAISESNREDFTSSAEAEMALLVSAVRGVDGNSTMWVGERELSSAQADAVLELIFAILGDIPIESRLQHTADFIRYLYEYPYFYMDTADSWSHPGRMPRRGICASALSTSGVDSWGKICVHHRRIDA